MQVEFEAVLDRVAEEMVEAVRRHGLEELSDKRWEQLEGPAVEVGDALTRKVLARLLGQQAEEVVGGDAGLSHVPIHRRPRAEHETGSHRPKRP